MLDIETGIGAVRDSFKDDLVAVLAEAKVYPRKGHEVVSTHTAPTVGIGDEVGGPGAQA